jgi:hypothetical protein
VGFSVAYFQSKLKPQRRQKMNAQIRRQIMDCHLAVYRSCQVAQSDEAGQKECCKKCPALVACGCRPKKAYEDLKVLAERSNPVAAIALRDNISLQEAFDQVQEALNECLELVVSGKSDEAEDVWQALTGLELDYLLYCLPLMD